MPRHGRFDRRGTITMMAGQARRFGEALVERHVMTRQTFEDALNTAMSSGEMS